jgi:hypothetical protein
MLFAVELDVRGGGVGPELAVLEVLVEELKKKKRGR